MAPIQDTQLEKVIDEVLKSGDVRALDAFLQWNIVEGIHIKCSQQFLTKLDKLVCRSLDKKDSRSAHLGLLILCKCGKNLKLPRDCRGLQGLIDQGLLKKMVQWFEKCRQLWIQCGPQWDESLFNLSEDFFDVLMVIYDSCKEGACKITESFLYRVGQLAVDPRIYILIQKEAIRKFNLILDKIPVELTKNTKILTSQEASDIMIKLARQILAGSDYDFQIAQMEALCRMVTPDQRKELADHWFSMEHVASAFVKIRDSEFETDCRKFLNMVNGMQGDRRSVFSYPCLEVYLDKYELLIPSDEKLEEFWIDFNLGSRSISFYFSLADEEAEEGQWETICITEDEVQSYTVTEEGKRQVLRLKLSEVVVVGAVEGSSLTIHFSSSLDILHAARSVYGHSKNKVVPESQLPPGESETVTASSAPVQMVSPAKMRISESTTAISSSTGRRARGARTFSAVMPSDTPAKGKGKPSLEMVRSHDRKAEFYLGEPTKTVKTSGYGTAPTSTIACVMNGQSDTSLQSATSKQASKSKNITEGKAVDMVLAGQGEEQSLEQGFVPDTQPSSGKNTTFNWSKLSVSEILMMPTQKISSRPEPCSSAHRSSVPVIGPNSQKQLHTVLTQRLQQVLNERNKDPVPQEPATPQRKTSDVREDSKDRGSTDLRALCASKEQQFQRNGLAKVKSKGQMSLDSAPMNTPANAFTNKARKEAIPPSVNAEANRALSGKEKRDAELAGSMVKLISSRYESTAKVTVENAGQSWNPPFLNRPIFNMSWLPTGKREVSGDEILKKSNRKTTATSIRQKKDVFTFSPDAPLSTGGKNKTFMNASAISSSHIYHSSELRSTTKKEQPVAKEKRHVKKHLFSDTDTDYATTDVSWLKESSRKPKPKVTKYPRPVKPKATSPRTSYESPDLPSSSQKPVKCESKPKKRKTNVKERVEQPKKRVKPAAPPNRPQAADRRPQRAAAISAKSYKEPDTEESQSESEMPSVFKRTSPDHLENAEKTHEVAQVKKKKTASKQPTKNYPKPENNNDIIQSESASELPLPSKKCFVGQRNENTCSEVPKGKKRKHTSCDQSTDSYRRADSNNQSALKKPSGLQQQRPENVDPEISKLRKTNVSLVQEQTNALKDSWAACQASFSPSPVFSERMRSAERSDPTLGLSCSPLLTPLGSPLPASPDPACQDTPSPILLLPKPCSTVNSKGNFKPSSIYSAGKKHGSSKAQSIQSVISLPSLTPVGQTPTRPYAGKMSPAQQSRPSPPPSRLPLLTSTMLELDKPSMTSPPESPFPEDIFTHGRHYGFRKVCSESQVSLTLSSNQSSVLSSRDEDSPTAVLAIKTEESPPSSQDLQPQLHVSGPSLKRCVSSSNTCEGEQKEARKKSKMRERHSPRMKPRKLFNSFAEVSAESEVIQVMSSSEMVSSSHWEAEVGDEDMDKNLEFPKADVNPSHLCQQFSSELKRVKDRSKMMEVYSRQSLKTIQQHFSSLNMSQRRKKVDEVLLEEIHKLEQDDTMLKSMERDLAMYWKKQSVAFHSYKELKNRRKETLAKALQSNVCHGLEYEERLFTSQMGLVRKDMKSFQDRLLCQMQEVEILSVKRGLHALFFP